jgi:predicted dehydrogenase
MSKKINWGIIGLGNIAHKFAQDLLLTPNAVLYGVASRDIRKSESFAKSYGAPKFFGSYEDLAMDPQIDIVYVATPHAFHFENTMLCLKFGKAVLCEKPMAMNLLQVKTMISEAKHKKLFLMEALWTRFIPCTEKLLDIIKSYSIGEVNRVEADFGFVADLNPESRVYNKDLGGGSLLDVGIYPIYLSLLLLGKPEDISAKARFTNTNVDGSCSMQFKYNNGKEALLESSVISNTPIEAMIYGTKGTIKMHKRFHHTESLTIQSLKGNSQTLTINYVGNGYYHEIVSVMECLNKGEIENEKVPHSMSLDIISTIDRVRNEIGLEY